MPRPRQLPPLDADDHQPEPDTGRTFTQKLAIYLTGIAIGLMFLGWTQYRKGNAARQQRAQQAAEVQRETGEAADRGVSNGEPNESASPSPPAANDPNSEATPPTEPDPG